MPRILFRDSDAQQEIRQHQIYMARPIDDAKSTARLEAARQEAARDGRVKRPAIDRSSAKFTETENGDRVTVECVLTFTGDSSVFAITPKYAVPPDVYGEAGWFENRDKLKLIKVFRTPADPDDVKAAFRSLLDDIDAALDAISLELEQHNSTIEDQVDRLIDARRSQLEGFENLRQGLSDGL